VVLLLVVLLAVVVVVVVWLPPVAVPPVPLDVPVLPLLLDDPHAAVPTMPAAMNMAREVEPRMKAPCGERRHGPAASGL
jgi:hypothetical protein